jgi:hypothetical protein
MWASLNAPLNADPRWPDVPKATSWLRVTRNGKHYLRETNIALAAARNSGIDARGTTTSTMSFAPHVYSPLVW